MLERYIIFGLIRTTEKDGKTYYIVEYMSSESGKTHNELVTKETYDSIKNLNIAPTTPCVANMEVSESNYAKLTSITLI